MKPIYLPIFCHNEETIKLENLNMDFTLTDCDIVKVKFYTINALSPYRDDDNMYTFIHSNGAEFICKLPIKEVEKLIEK